MGNTPLHEACAHGHVRVVQRLLANAQFPHMTKFGYLSKRRPPAVNARNDLGRTPLHVASTCNPPKISIVKILLDAGGSAEVLDNEKNTALDICTGQDVFQLLRSRAERPCLRTPEGGGQEVMVAMNYDTPFTADFWDADVVLAQMAARGLGRRLLTFPGSLGLDVVAATPAVSSAIRGFNDCLAELQRRTGGKLTGLGGLPLADLPAAAAELRRLRTELQLPGAILPGNYFNSAADVAALAPLLRVADETGALLLIHPGVWAAAPLPGPCLRLPSERATGFRVLDRAQVSWLGSRRRRRRPISRCSAPRQWHCRARSRRWC